MLLTLRKLETDTPQTAHVKIMEHATNNAHERLFGDMTLYMMPCMGCRCSPSSAGLVPAELWPCASLPQAAS